MSSETQLDSFSNPGENCEGDRSRLGVLISGVSQLASVSPFLIGLRERNVQICWFLVGGRDIEAAISEHLHPGDIVQILERSRVKFTLLKIVQIVLTPSSYSAMWFRWKRTVYFTRWFRILIRRKSEVRIRTIKNWLLADMVTDALGRLLGGYRLYPDQKTLVISTVCPDLDLVCGIRPKRVVFADGWDHLDKRPLGFRPDLVAPWNSDLGNSYLARVSKSDTPTVLLAANWPFKLSWVECVSDSTRHRSKNRKLTLVDQAVVLYAMTMSTDRRDRVRLLEEITLLNRVLDYLGNHTLLVKPKPGDTLETLESLGVDRRHLIQESLTPRLGDYHLSSQYNSARATTLHGVDVVVGVGTTFLLDAALAGIPVLRINSSLSSTPSLAEAMRSDHWILLDSIIKPRFMSLNKQQFGLPSASEHIPIDLRDAIHYSEQISHWLNPNGITASEASRRWWSSEAASHVIA